MSLIIAELYEEYQIPLQNYAMSLCRDAGFAEDLVHDTFARAMSNTDLLSQLPSYKRRSWLFSVMKNRFIDIKRKMKFETTMNENYEAMDSENIDGRIQAVGLLSSLPVKLRDVVFKKFWMGMNSAEIAKELAIPSGTVRYRLHNALNKIREELK